MSGVTIVYLRSLSYSGTSWINLIVGSHRDALALGPPDRIWKLAPEQAEQACLIHGAECGFWPEFVRGWDRSASFFRQLAEYSGKSVIVLNNPSPDLQKLDLADRSLAVRKVFVTRDGRANLASMMRHHPERYASVYDAARGWLQPALAMLCRQIEQAESRMHLRYEDMVADWSAQLRRVGEFIGLEYADNAIRYWEYDHHLVAGNTGVIDLLKRLQGLAGFEHRRSDYYAEMLEKTRDRPEVPVLDESWRERFTTIDRAAYDWVIGEPHEALGYGRDRFTTTEVAEFLRAHRVDVGPADTATNAAVAPVAPARKPSLLARIFGTD